MTARFDRLHVILALLIALGVGFRAVSNRRESRSQDQPALAAHLAALPARSERQKSARNTDAKVSVAKREAASTPEVRTERSPPGARAPLPMAQTPAYPIQGPFIDIERASAEELERLPGIGPSMAKRLVSDRQSNGPFVSLEGLQRVKGIGPRLAARLAPYVTFGGTGRPSNVISTPETAGAGRQGGSRRRDGRSTPHSP